MSAPIKVYCTDVEKAAIQTKAKAAGYSKLSQYVRDAALDESCRMMLAESIGYMVQLLERELRLEEEASIKEKLLAITQSLLDGKSIKQARAELKARFPEVSVQLRSHNGRKVGISFGIDGKAFAGRHLGRAYSLHGLQQYHKVRCEPDKQAGLLDEILSMNTKQCQQLYQQWRLLSQEKKKEQAPKQRQSEL